MKTLLSFLCLGLLLAACDEKSKVRKAVPTNPEAINKAQDDALGTNDPLNIQAGEFVYKIKTQEVFAGSPTPSQNLINEESVTVVDRMDYGDYIELTLVKEIIDHQQDGSPHFKFKDVFYLAVPPDPAETAASVVTKNLLPQEDTSTTPDPNKPVINYYNLSVEKKQIRAPDKVLEHTPCNENDGSCLIPITILTYDVEITVPPQKTTITSIETWMSTAVPYTSSVLKSCFKTVVSIGDARPVVRQCTSVVDYQFK
ncbi:MAG: hypothetical protein H6623_09290 [Bdellovibrionaceae bacterium]|nr:hypothetical protein [Pseudobdellovibrionaceae bacterium]